MIVIVGILLIVLIVVIVMLLSLVSYLLWDEVCDTYQKNRKRAIATKRLEDEMKRVCDETQTEYDKYREKIRPHDPHKDWLETESQTDCPWR